MSRRTAISADLVRIVTDRWRVVTANENGVGIENTIDGTKVEAVLSSGEARLVATTLAPDLNDVERQRDQAREQRAIAERQRDDAHRVYEKVCRERAEAVARAEAAEARTAPAVTREDVEKAIRAAFDGGGTVGEVREMADTVWSLVSGADPAVFVVRESDVAAVEVQSVDGGKWWLADGALVNMCESPTESEAQEAVDDALAVLAGALAARRAIEAGQATDPVEELAGQIESATREAIRQVCVDLADVAPSLDPLTVEQAMEVTAASRKVAAHVLGQEASDE